MLMQEIANCSSPHLRSFILPLPTRLADTMAAHRFQEDSRPPSRLKAIPYNECVQAATLCRDISGIKRGQRAYAFVRRYLLTRRNDFTRPLLSRTRHI